MDRVAVADGEPIAGIDRLSQRRSWGCLDFVVARNVDAEAAAVGPQVGSLLESRNTWVTGLLSQRVISFMAGTRKKPDAHGDASHHDSRAEQLCAREAKDYLGVESNCLDAETGNTRTDQIHAEQ